jgi:uncharacterized protein DUF5666
MNLPARRVLCFSGSISISKTLILLLFLSAYLTSGCGGGGTGMMTPPPPPAPTAVTVVVTSTANGQFASFNVDINSITFQDQAGQTVTVLAAPTGPAFTQTYEAEFMHLNGQMAPLLTTSLQQDVIVSATVTYTYAQFTHVGINGSQALETITDVSGGPTAAAQTATVNLPKPITIQGSAMTLALDLQASSSGSFVNHGGSNDTFAVTPTFTLDPVTVPAQSKLQLTGVAGTVTAVNAASSSVTLLIDYAFNNPVYPDGAPFTVATVSSTVYQGVAGFSALVAGTIANVDLALQSDGSLVATRIEVADTSATNVLTGPLGSVFGAQGEINVLGRTNEEFNQSNTPGGTVGVYSYDGSTVFQVSGQVGSLTNLPFAATFDSSSMVAGQNVAVGSQTIATSAGTFTHATSITLEPQTINGTVTAISSSGGFTVYEVTLASYDLFTVLAVQLGQTPVLQNYLTVEVYVGSDTRMLNSSALAMGSVVRFNGLVFDDAGIARMVCLQVNDGVAE